MPGWVETGFQEYARRIRPMQNLELVQVPAAKRRQGSTVQKIKADEADLIEQRLHDNETRVVLDVEGEPLSTKKLARVLATWQMEGTDIALLVGGPDGLDSRFLEGDKYRKISLSALTLPHSLVRLVLAEQIYRGLAMNAHHPYHRE